MFSRALLAFAAAALLLVPATGQAQLTPYAQDFESLVQADPAALSNDGWVVYGNVFDSGGNFVYGYGTFPAPNGGSGFCAIDAGQGGPPQGAQQLSIYGDYNNQDQDAATLNYTVKANTFQEQTIGVADVGVTYAFRFDAKLGNLVPPSGNVAFIRTIDPTMGFALTNEFTIDTSTLPVTWGTYQIAITIDPALPGQLLQFGFEATSNNFIASGVFYDNITFQMAPAGTPVADDYTAGSWGSVKSLYR